MNSSLNRVTQPAPLRVPESGAQMAKVGLRSAENPQHVKHGACMKKVMQFLGLSLEEFAFALGKDERQIARQMLGQERPQIEAVLAVDRFQGVMIVALAESAAGVSVDTVIHVRRTL